MYRRKYMSLDEAVGVIAERLTTYSNGLSGIEDARGQLIEALYDGAVRSEGISWQLVEAPPLRTRARHSSGKDKYCPAVLEK
jgi:hypothetical protein